MSAEETRSELYFFSDLHGHDEQLRAHLKSVGLVDADLNWKGADSILWFLGDYVDNGPRGLAVIEVIQSLQKQAQESGGKVGALVGNHDVFLLAVHAFREHIRRSTGSPFYEDWLENGGSTEDLAQLEDHHRRWLANLPAMALQGEYLLLHADAMFYTAYGEDLQSLNRTFATLLSRGSPEAFDRLLVDFSQHHAFQGERGELNVHALLSRYGGEKIIHGHTPISKVTGENPEQVSSPYIYQEDRCINIDGGMYLGGPGFIFSPETHSA